MNKEFYEKYIHQKGKYNNLKNNCIKLLNQEGGKKNKTKLNNNGRVILAPPGSGKSTWIKRNPKEGWVEGDDLYPHFFKGKKRTLKNLKMLEELNGLFKSFGYKILTGDWYELNHVDAIVLPDPKELKKRLDGEKRPGHDPEKAHKLILEFVNKRDDSIPIFETIDEAVIAVNAK